MKHLVTTLLFVVAGLISVQAQDKKNSKAPRFEFTEETHDFGTLPEGPKAIHVFKFKNVGKEPLIIQNASASCGCTTPNWPKEPILPGKTGSITVEYNTQGRVSPFNKDIYILSNAEIPDGKERYELHIKGTVVHADEFEKNKK